MSPSCHPLDPELVGAAWARLARSATDISNPHQLFLWQRTHLNGFVPHGAWACWLRSHAASTDGVWLNHSLPLPPATLDLLRQPRSTCWTHLLTTQPQRKPIPTWFALPTAIPEEGLAPFDGVWLAPVLDEGGQVVALHTLWTDPALRPSAPPMPHQAETLRWCLPLLHHGALAAQRRAAPAASVCAPPPTSGPLTAREVQVLQVVSKTGRTAEAAALLNVSTATIKNHLRRISVKLGVRSRAQAIAMAMAAHWLP